MDELLLANVDQPALPEAPAGSADWNILSICAGRSARSPAISPAPGDLLDRRQHWAGLGVGGQHLRNRG
jgi:hypothetical protein